jgi:hypothetical protein
MEKSSGRPEEKKGVSEALLVPVYQPDGNSVLYTSDISKKERLNTFFELFFLLFFLIPAAISLLPCDF